MPDLLVEFSNASGRTSISRLAPDSSTAERNAWSELSHLALATDVEATIGPNALALDWSSYLQIAQHIRQIALRAELHLDYGENARRLLSRWKSDRIASVSDAPQVSPATADNLDEELRSAGWDLAKRTPTHEQRRDILKAISLRNGAVFSVPGAGKTTVALAVHQLFARSNPCNLLVVAPNNAFPAWDEALEACLGETNLRFCRLTGGETAIRALLQGLPRYAVISYAQLARVGELIGKHLLDNSTHVVLDESHRIKAGRQGQIASEIAKIAPFALRRDILSGTPMPQARADLEPQFEFLYPATDIGHKIRTASDLQAVIGPLFVRTRYSELGVPRPIPAYLEIEMSNSQRLLYAFLRDQFVRQAVQTRTPLAAQRTSVMRLMMAAIDPQTAAERLLVLPDTSPELRDVCSSVLDDGLSPRLQMTISEVDRVVSEGRKIVLWAPFNLTLERLDLELASYGPRILYGQTPTGDVDQDGTREQIVHEFHNSASCRVLIANPAAGGEGISLHKVCQDAIYVGRTYNATHYMQSRDRICRLGMPEGTIPRISVVECRAPSRLGSIDLSIRRRLDSKIDQMAQALDDPDLHEIALESDDADQDLEDGFTLDDLLDLARELTRDE
jgi:hypothetical protein